MGFKRFVWSCCRVLGGPTLDDTNQTAWEIECDIVNFLTKKSPIPVVHGPSCLGILERLLKCHAIAKWPTGLRKRCFTNCSTNERSLLLLHFKLLRLRQFRLRFKKMHRLGRFAAFRSASRSAISLRKPKSRRFRRFLLSRCASPDSYFKFVSLSVIHLSFCGFRARRRPAFMNLNCRYKSAPFNAACAVFCDKGAVFSDNSKLHGSLMALSCRFRIVLIFDIAQNCTSLLPGIALLILGMYWIK